MFSHAQVEVLIIGKAPRDQSWCALFSASYLKINVNTYPGDVNFDQLVEVVFDRFLHYKGIYKAIFKDKKSKGENCCFVYTVLPLQEIILYLAIYRINTQLFILTDCDLKLNITRAVEISAVKIIGVCLESVTS